jgi:hypothetical protein
LRVAREEEEEEEEEGTSDNDELLVEFHLTFDLIALWGTELKQKE